MNLLSQEIEGRIMDRNIAYMSIKSTVKELINCLNSGFEIIMESDLVSLLFHCCITTNPELVNKIHTDTRVYKSEGLRTDLVVGKITLEGKRPSVIPDLVIECKIFGYGFTSSQLNKRYKNLQSDLYKINKINQRASKYIIIYDYCKYLNGFRKSELRQIRESLDSEIVVLLINRMEKFSFHVL